MAKIKKTKYWLLILKTAAHLTVLIALFFLAQQGWQGAKYLFIFYFFILFLEPRFAGVFLLILIFTLPFLVYKQKLAIAESYATSAFFFLSGATVGHLARIRKNFKKIFFPLAKPAICLFVQIAIFILAVILPFVAEPGFLSKLK